MSFLGTMVVYCCCGFSSHKTLILSPWWSGTVSSGAHFRPTAPLLPAAGRPDEGRLRRSCTAHYSPLLLPRPHEAGGYAVLACTFTHAHVQSLHLTNYQLPSKNFSIKSVWYYFWHLHMAYCPSPVGVTFIAVMSLSYILTWPALCPSDQIFAWRKYHPSLIACTTSSYSESLPASIWIKVSIWRRRTCFTRRSC